jgi:hypothetical protein
MTEIGKVDIDYLTRPDGVVHEFVTYLAGNAIRLGRGSALGFYLKKGMEEQAHDFFSRCPVEPEHVEEVTTWIESLPWNRIGYLVLVFNW